MDVTMSEVNVTIPPNLGCGVGSTCALRLVRSASDFGPDYRFWSCSDIQVEDSPAVTTPTASRDECLVDSDCAGRAKCINTGSTKEPLRQCFCEAGYSGYGTCGQVIFLYRQSAHAHATTH